MKNYILILFIFLSSCAVIPRSENKAKRKISKYKDKIEMIAAYHNLDSIWIEKKKFEFTLPEYKNKFELELKPFNKLLIDSVLVENCKDVEKIKEIIYQECEPENLHFEDSVLVLDVIYKKDGVEVNYKIKSQKIEKEVPCEQTGINANIPWYKERPVRIGFILILILTTLFLTKRFLR